MAKITPVLAAGASLQLTPAPHSTPRRLRAIEGPIDEAIVHNLTAIIVGNVQDPGARKQG